MAAERAVVARRLALIFALAAFPANAETTSETDKPCIAIATLQRADAMLGKARAGALAAADTLAKIYFDLGDAERPNRFILV